MKNYFVIVLISSLLYSCQNESNTSESNIAIPIDSIHLQTKDSVINKCILTDGFDFPVGNADGKGKYTSLTDHKEYNSWYVTVKTGDSFKLGIHTGEDWNGSGGGNTDFGQPVYSIGSGIVLSAQSYEAPLGKVVVIKHCFSDNHKDSKVFSVYAHLNEITVKAGDTLGRRQQIGTIGTGGGDMFSAHLHLEIRKAALENYPVLFWPTLAGKDKKWVLENYEAPSDFINKRRKL